MKTVAEKLGVTEQQARNYREKLNSRVETNEVLAKIKDQLKNLRLSFLEAEDREK